MVGGGIDGGNDDGNDDERMRGVKKERVRSVIHVDCNGGRLL